MREIRRRTRVVGAFPDGQSCLNLLLGLRLHRRVGLIDQTIHEHAPSLSNPGRTNRSRRLIKCAKESGRYRSPTAITSSIWSGNGSDMERDAQPVQRLHRTLMREMPNLDDVPPLECPPALSRWESTLKAS